MRFSLLFLLASLGFSADTALDALIRERIMTARPDRAQAQVYPDGAIMIGDLFHARTRIAIAVSRSGEQLHTLALLIHRKGDWQEIERHALGTAEQPFSSSDESPLSLVDLDGDKAPELLITEHGGGDNRQVSVWRFDKELAQLKHVGSQIRNPQWQTDRVRCTWKLGVTSGDIGAEEYRWSDGFLRRTWLAEQRYPLQEYLIGSAEPAVHVQQIRVNTDGSEETVRVVGNIAHAGLRLPPGESPRAMWVQLTDARGRSRIHIIPRMETLRQLGLTALWDSLISDAIFTQPSAFSQTMTVNGPDGKKILLADIADVRVEPSALATTFHYLSIDDDARRSIEESSVYPAIALSPVVSPDLATHNAQALIQDWSRAILSPDTTLHKFDAQKQAHEKLHDYVAYIRLPNVTGYSLSQIETGTVVTDCSLRNNILSIAITCAYGTRPTLPTKDVARPLISLAVGPLSGEKITLRVVIQGLEKPHELTRRYALK
jgi:hypothetical protein